MLNSELKKQILDTTFLVRLNTGELLATIAVSRADGSLSLFFPCLFDEELKMTDFCEYAKNRRIEMSVHGIQFIKAPNYDLMDSYFMHVISKYPNDFLDFIKYLDDIVKEGSPEIAASVTETELKSRVLH